MTKNDLTYVEEKDPHYNYYADRPKDTNDVVFGVQLDIDDKTGLEIVNFGITEAKGYISPYHQFSLKDGNSRLSKEEFYITQIENPFYYYNPRKEGMKSFI